MDHSGGESGQSIVVAKFDFCNGESVILVDDWDRAHMEQLCKGVLCIEILRSVGYVASSEQNLGYRLTSVHEELIPQAHELALTDSSECLDFREMLRATGQTHVAKCQADSARRAYHHFVALFLKCACCFDDDRETR